MHDGRLPSCCKSTTIIFRWKHSWRKVNNGLHLLLFDEGLVRLYHLIAPVLIRNKDDKLKSILVYALTTHHSSRNAPPLALFEYITSEHNILSIREPFLKFKETESKLFGNYKVPLWIGTGFSKAMMQAVLQEYLGENIAQYLSRIFRITKGIIPHEENKTTRLHVCSFHFLKLIKDFIKNMIERPAEVSFTSVFVPWGVLSVATTLSRPY